MLIVQKYMVLSDTNKDLPIAKFSLSNAYYNEGQRLLPS